MTDAPVPPEPSRPRLRRWAGRAWLLLGILALGWVANSYRTRGVADETLRSGPTVMVRDGAARLELLPAASDGKSALVFICGSGVAAPAYAPLLRPVAEAGHPVFIIKLPCRFAPFESHRQAAAKRALEVIAAHPGNSRWVVAGHSLGGALACRVAQTAPAGCAALVLVGTTHPKQEDLSALAVPVTKVFASNDGVARAAQVLANQRLLPKDTRWVEIQGGNHSQFAHYGHQLGDGEAAISREAQQAATRSALLAALADATR
ncbi:MAG: hypothetical protein FD161_875 [Limisphaerales bacterium]|nr:MAG: hypothetical protein FD161_875 [Limisphaerales bacterium]KAG0510034.1 MAG: hypothetical protein E1N63_875 [Limisphaerales bacterium]TXT53076.1 MAG: hypothetical protein FD140_184 [Limisphaerales bacterium]